MNGKGDRPRKKGVDEATWEKNWESIFGKKEKKALGVRVEIDLGDGKKDEGYIVRRHNVDNYEIWAEGLQKVLFLCKKEFKEVN